MKSLYNDIEANEFKTDLDLRVYTSRLLGKDPSLVLHGGGNTSVKSTATNLFGEREDILYVKGSGWDLSTIEAEGFAPVKMEMLLKMAELKELNDTDMVKYQRLAMTNPSAPNPSVEAILHAIIPFKFVDHTHTDAVITITNTQGGEEKIKELYGDKVLVIPYIMPGFVLAKLVYDMTRDVDWSKLEGMVLMNHGLFTFNDDAKKSYEKTIELVDKAEKYLDAKGAVLDIKEEDAHVELLELAKIRKEVSAIKGYATISILNDSDLAVNFSKGNVEKIATQGPLTPDHVIRTKRVPAIFGDDFKLDLAEYVEKYKQYFEENKKDETLLNPAPNFAVLKDKATLSFGKNVKEANIIKDINDHTFEAILKAEKLGGYKALSAANIFEVEYWELEQAKLKKGGTSPEFSGKVAIVTGAASGAGLATAKMLNSKGAAVVALDINEEVETIFNKADAIGMKCDLTCSDDIQNAISRAVKSFGGIDIVVADTNLATEQSLIKECTPFLKLGIEPAIVMLASKEFSSQTTTIALELKEYGIRVNTITIDEVVETGKNSETAAELTCAMAGKAFARTTSSEVSIDC